jgi:putative hydrolase of the HAD superfamily
MTQKNTTSERPEIPPFKAAIFDLDDTLYPEQQYALSGFRAVSEYVRTLYNLNIYEGLVQRYLSGERMNVFGATLEQYFKTVEPEFLRRVVYVYWAHHPRIDLFSDARVCLALLISRGIPVGLLTAGQSAIQRKKVAALELEPLLDALVYADDLLGPKQPCQPCDDAFHIMALQLGVELGQMLYIGDNPLVDFITPRQLGMKTVRIRRKHGEHACDEPPTPEHAPDITLTGLEELTGACMTADTADGGESP